MVLPCHDLNIINLDFIIVIHGINTMLNEEVEMTSQATSCNYKTLKRYLITLLLRWQHQILVYILPCTDERYFLIHHWTTAVYSGMARGWGTYLSTTFRGVPNRHWTKNIRPTISPSLTMLYTINVENSKQLKRKLQMEGLTRKFVSFPKIWNLYGSTEMENFLWRASFVLFHCPKDCNPGWSIQEC